MGTDWNWRRRLADGVAQLSVQASVLLHHVSALALAGMRPVVARCISAG